MKTDKHPGLVSLADRSPEERRRIASAGGIASREARQQRKKLREELEAILSSGDTQEHICAALVSRAKEGDVHAFSTIRDTLGEKIPDRSINVDLDIEMIRSRYGEEIRDLYAKELDNSLAGRESGNLQLLEKLSGDSVEEMRGEAWQRLMEAKENV